jgi:beta-glucosidase
MWVNPELNASDAFVAAFLPGSEGGGIADVLFRKADGAVNHDFRGRLSYSWPKRADQTPLNRGDAKYDPLFAYGYGLTYADARPVPRLSEERPAGAGLPEGVLFGRGAVPEGWRFGLQPAGQERRVDRRAQEDSRSFTWPGDRDALLVLKATPALDLSRETTGQLSLVVEYRLDTAPTRPVTLQMVCGIELCAAPVPIGGELRAAPLGVWRTLTIPLGCFARAPAFDPKHVEEPLEIRTEGRLSLAISDIRIASATVPQNRCGAE